MADQRKILAQTTGKPADQTPQLWVLYKEGQDYYDKGMRVPDDVTLLLCDDNWGNLRKLPAEYKDAYYQLVLYPVKACANLNELYATVAQTVLRPTRPGYYQ